MHDFENAVYDELATRLEAQFEGLTLVTTDLPGEPTFPVAQFRPIDYVPDASSAESGDPEVRTVTVWELQAYSNRSRREAKQIAVAADALMSSWGWQRTTLAPVESQDRTIRRFAVRWRGSVDADGYVSR